MKLLDFATPHWFATPQMLLYFFFALITLVIAYNAYKIFKFTKNEKIAYFGIAFFGLSVGYFLQALIYLFVMVNISTSDLIGHASSIVSLISLSYVATIIHMITMLLALVILTFVTLRKERGVKIFLLIFSLTFLTFILSSAKGLTFFLLSGTLLLFITAQYVQKYLKKPTRTTYYISSGFSLLFLGELFLALTYAFSQFCLLGHIVILGGYILLLMSLFEMKK